MIRSTEKDWREDSTKGDVHGTHGRTEWIENMEDVDILKYAMIMMT